MKQFTLRYRYTYRPSPPLTMTKWTNRTLDIKFIRKDEGKGNLLQTFHETERSRESDVSSSNPKSHQVTNIKRRGWRVYKVDHTLENLSGVK